MNIKIIIEYNGKAYCGWQVQRKNIRGKKINTQNTVQGKIEEVLEKIFQVPVRVTGASRTDSGVHAIGQVANFRVEGRMPVEKLRYSMNTMLPADIVITGISGKSEDFNARYNAKSKVYEYRILNRGYRSAAGANNHWHVWQALDLENMKKACRYLEGRHDFAPLAAAGSPRKNTRCNIMRLEVSKKGSIFRVLVEADFFLYKMVRNMAGLLVQVGRGDIAPGEIKGILEGRKKIKLLTAPAGGLCLLKVKYK